MISLPLQHQILTIMKTRPGCLIIVILFFFSLNLAAGTVDVQRARKVAGNYMEYLNLRYKAELGKSGLASPYIYLLDGEPVFYAFDTRPGFIIVSAEDAMTPVIGYSYEGRFEYDDAPAHYKSFLQGYIDQVKYIREYEMVAELAIKKEWEQFTAGMFNGTHSGRDNREVEPLLICKWNQNYPYNILCPEDPAGPGGHVYAGCVATAMAQVMYYWRYPESGEGYYCYEPPNYWYGIQCADFGGTEYAWEGMKNMIDRYNADPIAELQYHCAVSVDMMFGPNGSGSYSFLVPGAIGSYFRYDDAEYLEMDYYSLSDWITILQDELDQKHPMYYSGFGSAGGHAFVCDGYQGDDFHFNFGWGGSADGYYSLYSVNGFSYGQACVRNFVPSDPAYPYHASGSTIITQKSGSITDGSGPAADYTNNQSASWTIDGQDPGDSIASVTLKFYEFNLLAGDTLKIFDGENTDAPLLAAFSGSEIPDPVNSTGNKMMVTFSSDGSGTSTGWYAEYKANSAIYCDGLVELTEPYGYIEDGSGTYDYRDYAICKWLIDPPYANSITISFEQFDTENTMDFLNIYEGTSLIASYSGHQIPDPVVINSGSAFLIWCTNEEVTYEGWRLYYEIDNVGNAEHGITPSIDIYPNPASDQLHAVFDSRHNGPISIRMIDLAGQVVSEEFFEGPAAQYHVVMDVQGFASGIYILELKSAGSLTQEKVIIE